MTSPTFRRMLTQRANIKRSPPIVGGKRGPATLLHTGIPCSPIDPLTEEEIRQRVGLNSPMRLWQTFVEGAYDVRPGDYLEAQHSERALQVYSVNEWADFPTVGGPGYLHLLLEEPHR